MMREPITGLLALAILPVAAEPAAVENPCHAQATNQRWEELAAENHGSDAIQCLYALRLGFCFQVERVCS